MDEDDQPEMRIEYAPGVMNDESFQRWAMHESNSTQRYIADQQRDARVEAMKTIANAVVFISLIGLFLGLVAVFHG